VPAFVLGLRHHATRQPSMAPPDTSLVQHPLRGRHPSSTTHASASRFIRVCSPPIEPSGRRPHRVRARSAWAEDRRRSGGGPPKTGSSVRDIDRRPAVVAALKVQKAQQAAERLQHGRGASGIRRWWRPRWAAGPCIRRGTRSRRMRWRPERSTFVGGGDAPRCSSRSTRGSFPIAPAGTAVR